MFRNKVHLKDNECPYIKGMNPIWKANQASLYDLICNIKKIAEQTIADMVGPVCHVFLELTSTFESDPQLPISLLINLTNQI